MTIISSAIDRIQGALNGQTDDAQKKLYKTLDIELFEKTKYFDINSQSFAGGVIDLETSQFIYNKLRDYEHTTLSERIVITKLMQELLQKRMQKH